uniref:Transmembrane 9 superfamily member n=1 Tax=Strigamia maritima TaxID=126957 RepID=T1ITP6_STRMM
MATLCRILTLLAVVENIAFATIYNKGDKVFLYVNKVGPYFNPHETYHYYQLPVCRPEKIEHRSLTLGEVLDGDRMAHSNYDIQFQIKTDNKELCKVTLNKNDLNQLKEAIEDLYYFEFVIDDIPVRGFIGHLDENGIFPHKHYIFLWTHFNFVIEYNKDKIIYANVTTKDHDPVKLDDIDELEVTYTYSVKWIETELSYENRGKRLQATGFFPKTLEIHWLSIINSIVLVFLLIGFVVIILMRVLKNDFARYNMDDDDAEDMDNDEYGWKIIHTDVFRFPPNKNLFCAILGVGSQFLAIAFGIIAMALLGMFNVHKHGSMNTAACFLYAVTSGIAGFVSSSMYHKMSVPFFIIWSVQNTVAWIYHSTQALPFSTIVLLMLVWLFVGYPLTIMGAILGRNWAGEFNAPCRAKNISREIPSVPWYRSAVAHCLIGGFLPFSAISVEMYYIFATLWGREQYTLYGILLVVLVILISVTACISVALTYFQLSSEDYRWWWRSIASAGSTGLFVLLYSLFYYFKRSNMSGVLQTVEFFGWTVLTCYIFFLSLGTVSFFASLKFIRYIYVNIKMD